MKSVLIVANDFPPIGGAGVQRAFYLAKYLPEFGWAVHVLTVKDVAFPVMDASSLEALRDSVTIHRTESLEFRRILRILSGLLPARTNRRGPGAGARPGEWNLLGGLREFGRSLRRWIAVPDDRIGWLPFATIAARRVKRETGFHCVIATVPPYSSGLIGSRIARAAGVPLVLDLRDPWIGDPHVEHATRFHAKIDAAIERSVYRSAAAITVVAPVFRERLLERYAEISENRVKVVYNGFDADLYRAPAPAIRTDSIAYVGSLYAHHQSVLRQWFEGWRLAAAEDEAVRRLRFDVFGRCDPEIHAIFREVADTVAIRYHGYVKHAEAVRALRSAAGCVFFIKDHDPATAVVSIPGKLFEILAAERPVLLVSPRGDASELVTARAGTWCSNSDVRGIANWLIRLERGDVPPSFLEERFTREAIAREFSGILNGVLVE